MKNLKGGYKIIDLELNDLSSNFTVKGLHESISLSNKKPLLITQIVINGVKKNDVYVKPSVSGTSYVLEVYDKKLTVKSDDTVTVSSFTEYDPNKVLMKASSRISFGSGTGGTMSDADFNKIKENPNAVFLPYSDDNVAIANAYVYPLRDNSNVGQYGQYHYMCVNIDGTTAYITLISVSANNKQYSLTIKTIS